MITIQGDEKIDKRFDGVEVDSYRPNEKTREAFKETEKFIKNNDLHNSESLESYFKYIGIHGDLFK